MITPVDTMFGKPKKRGLYYLLPGMTRANRRRQKQILRWSIWFGLVVSAIIGFLMYWLNTPHYF